MATNFFATIIFAQFFKKFFAIFRGIFERKKSVSCAKGRYVECIFLQAKILMLGKPVVAVAAMVEKGAEFEISSCKILSTWQAFC